MSVLLARVMPVSLWEDQRNFCREIPSRSSILSYNDCLINPVTPASLVSLFDRYARDSVGLEPIFAAKVSCALAMEILYVFE